MCLRVWAFRRHVNFLTGTDEHGQKVQSAAGKAGISPQKFTDSVTEFRDLLDIMNFSNDHHPQLKHAYSSCQAIWKRLLDKGSLP